MDQQTNLRNLIIAAVAVMGIMLVWQIFVWGPQNKAAQETFEAEQARIQAEEQMNAPSVPAGETLDAATPTVQDVRVPFDGPSVDGSILLRGARVDQLSLKDYYQTLEDKEAQNPEGEVEVFHPEATGVGYYGFWGWKFAGADDLTESRPRYITTAASDWQLVSGETLTPDTPITIQFQGGGVTISRQVTLDENYMFTFNDTVTNNTGREIALQPYGVLRQFGRPLNDRGGNNASMILHEGVIAATGNELQMKGYKKMEKDEAAFSASSAKGGWIGLTDKYWLGAVIPQQDRSFTVNYDTYTTGGKQEFRAIADGEALLLAPGTSSVSTNHIFGGAKESSVLRGYQEDLGIPRFIDAIDWGSMFFWLTKPFFSILSFINGYVGNFGLSILVLTVLVKAVFFPIQNRAYQSMAKMRELAEPMKRIREEVEDKQEQQRQLAELYREKKVNPVSGCLPILLQMPVFYGLYKTLYVTIEMRHEPFPLLPWVDDLSAPDPTAIGNLFGLLPISTDAVTSIPLLGVVLAIGILPIVYGLTMWALQSLNPPPQDDTQRMIFAFLPIVFTFIFAGFAAGLVIYWCWSNMLSILQQYVIMRRNGQKTQLDKFIDARLGKGETKN